ncbi:hypothetical protein H8B15_09260 [Hymenobacter sp. BT507]|uniref:T9SS type A sorting domain-containing protein n=1 Tax=Hymenobacter citatus TaxID=2763506 RepID=A0ABR7MJ74_9BACT|nr:hypothetical protein [Hymenobacter citatus]MBC6611111.1 hypothetical protein [Hymenobacter citatus]
MPEARGATSPQDSIVHLSRVVSGTLLDLTGCPVRTLAATGHLKITGLTSGVYLLRITDGAISKLVVR